MPVRSSRNRNKRKISDSNGKIFIQIIFCIAFICAFMMFKDVKLANGKTPRDYANQILTTTVNLPEIIAEFKEEAVVPAGADVKNP